MKKLMLTVAGAALAIGMALPGQAQTLDADCQKMFETADVNKDGSLGAGESDKFIILMSTKPKDAAIVTMDEFMAECRKDAFKGMQEAAVTPDTNTAAKSSSDAATTTEQPAATAEQPAATAEQPAATAEQPAATAEQPAATAEQPAATAEQPAATAEQPAATAEQPAATAEQPAATAEQPAATAEQPAATAEQPAATAEQPAATAEQPAATAEQPAATAEQPAATAEQPTATAEQPAATAEQPAATAEQPAATGQAPGNMLASKLIGTTVVSIDNRNIGEINDIVIDVENQEAAQAIIGVGGFLGIGEKNVAVELKRLDVRADLETNAWTVVLDTTEEELKQLPEYKAAAN